MYGFAIGQARISEELVGACAAGKVPASRSAKPEAVLLEQTRDAADVELQPVACRDVRRARGVGWPVARQLAHLVEIALEAGRRDDLEQSRRAVAGIPERVPLGARLEDQVARLAVDDLVAEQGADAALEHEAVLVLAAVAVERCAERARRPRLLRDG